MGICDVFFQTSAHEDVLVEVPLSRGAHHKIKQLQCWNKYKTGVCRSDQLLPNYSFKGKTIKCWKKLFFIYSTRQLSMHTSCMPKQARKKSCCIFSTKKSLCAGMEIQVQGQTSSPACRLIGGETIFYIDSSNTC